MAGMGPAAGVPDATGASVGFGFGFGLVSVMRVLPCAAVGGTAASPPRDDLVVVPIHVVDKLRALVLGMGLSKLHSDGGLSCFIVRPSSHRSADGSWSTES